MKIIYLLNRMIYFIFLPPHPALLSPDDRFAPPLRSPPAEPPRPCTLRSARMFLVGCCFCLTRREPSKATTSFILDFFSPSIRCPVQGDNPPPHVLPWPPLHSNVPPNVDADFCLIVVSPNLKGGHHSGGAPFLSLFFYFLF